MKAAADRADEGEDQAFGRFRSEESEPFGAQQIANEETQLNPRAGPGGARRFFFAAALRARSEEPVATEAAAALRYGLVAAQVGLSQRADPGDRNVRGRRRKSSQPYRPSKG